jgi:hypothetical protein
VTVEAAPHGADDLRRQEQKCSFHLITKIRLDIRLSPVHLLTL